MQRAVERADRHAAADHERADDARREAGAEGGAQPACGGAVEDRLEQNAQLPAAAATRTDRLRRDASGATVVS